MPSDNLDGDSPCHPHACAIQSCMQKTWDQDKCQALIDDLHRCCARFYIKKPGAATESCPLESVVRKRLKGMNEDGLLKDMEKNAK
ncbi:DUF1903-domain-containing protein [Acaromyces ingoldii]|uniref:Cx9C motif-containing protein 4, mitochondrial n=1 Tax=Acaromyces ingoldii TaxID=215250 RepID=A0A316YKB2_9BASI|nr:DUF1903-domain-containing protein [Acaromyces ingoldii]PWN89867.1 DUF1903-domain-containing protein [Acaromyces ingoldii]